jgi:PTH1 family peptidyl-tRNA hydrolase
MALALICLGNRGKTYEFTRHNIGWMLCDHLLEESGEQPSWMEKFHSRYSELFTTFGTKTILQLPQMMMNRSGISVRELSTFFKLPPSSLIVVHDDLETAFGQITFQLGGGHGGHNGIRSVIKELGTPDFYRLKIGIGRPAGKEQVHSYVLSKFYPDQQVLLPRILTEASRLLSDQIFQQPVALPKGRKITKSVE